MDKDKKFNHCMLFSKNKLAFGKMKETLQQPEHPTREQEQLVVQQLLHLVLLR